jgi:hypothetical protein
LFHLVAGEDLHRHSLLSNPIDLSIKYLKWIRVAQTQIACEHVFPQIFRENRFSVFLAVLDEFVIHICSNLGEKFRFKKSEKIVDTVTLRYDINKFQNSKIRMCFICWSPLSYPRTYIRLCHILLFYFNIYTLLQ